MDIARLPGGWTSSSSSAPSAVPSSRRPSEAASSPSATVSGATRGAAHAEAVVRVGAPRCRCAGSARARCAPARRRGGWGPAGAHRDRSSPRRSRLPPPGARARAAGPVPGPAAGRPDRPAGGPGCRSRRPGRIGSVARRCTGPASSSATGRMMQTPVSASPAWMARSTGAAPRQRGSSDGMHVVGLVGRQQRLADDRAVGAHQQRVGRGRGDRPRPPRARSGRRAAAPRCPAPARARPPAAPGCAGRARAGGRDARPPARAVVGAGHAIQHRRGEIRSSEVDGAHMRHPRGEPNSARRCELLLHARPPSHRSPTRPTAAGWPTGAGSAARCSRPAGCWARPWSCLPGRESTPGAAGLQPGGHRGRRPAGGPAHGRCRRGPARC